MSHGSTWVLTFLGCVAVGAGLMTVGLRLRESGASWREVAGLGLNAVLGAFFTVSALTNLRGIGQPGSPGLAMIPGRLIEFAIIALNIAWFHPSLRQRTAVLMGGEHRHAIAMIAGNLIAIGVAMYARYVLGGWTGAWVGLLVGVTPVLSLILALPTLSGAPEVGPKGAAFPSSTHHNIRDSRADLA